VDHRAQFGANLLALRSRRRLTQEALADLCDLHPTEISLLERGGREPRLGTILKLAHALGVKPARLLDGLE
jgi:transcriptional regulator with XRE-family HTH domain